MPIAGLVRLRKHQFGRQASFGTKVAATRAYPVTGVPDVNRNWTDPEIDTGSLDPTAAPYTTAGDFTADHTFNALTYDDLPLLLSGMFGDAVAPTTTGTSESWAYAPASLTPDAIDCFTYEFGDDVTTDWFQLGDGIIESLEFTGPDGLGPVTASANWRFGSASSTGATDFPVDGVVPTPGLSVDTNGVIVYLKDAGLYIADTFAGLGAGQITDALHTFTLRVSQEVDQKRWANGDQSFDVDAYGRGARSIELECTFAKTSQTVGTGSEADDWFSEQAVTRYVRVAFESLVEASIGVPYSWEFTMPMRYYTRADSEIGGNTVVVLTGHAFYDPTAPFTGVFKSTVVNQLSEADLGLAGS